MRKWLSVSVRFNWVMGVVAVLFAACGIFAIFISPALAEAVTKGEPMTMARAIYAGTGFIAAAVSVAGGCVGAGVAVSMVGAAAMGAVAERPELMGRTLLFVGIAEGIAIYGVVFAIMILAKI